MIRRPAPRPARWRRTIRRVWTVAVLTPLLVLASASRAAADSDASRPAAALSWMEIHDSRGISIWSYDLSLDRGGITDPLKMIWSVFADIGWHIYTWLVGSAVWLIDFTLSFGWLEPFEGPAEAISDSLADVITRFGALPVILTLAAAVAAVLMMAGRFATGLYEFFAAATVAALAVGVLASPIDYFTGGDSWLIQARNLGLQVGGSLSAEPGNRQSPSPEKIREDLSEQLADIFIRAPHQLVNYNAVIDGTRCEDAYDAGIMVSNARVKYIKNPDGTYRQEAVDANGNPIKLPDGMDADDVLTGPVSKRTMPARTIVEKCDPALGEAAANPSFTQVINTMALGLGGIFLAILALALCLAVWASAIYALVLAIKALVNLITGILPGGQRLGLTRTIAEVIIALIIVMAAVVFLMAYLQVVTSVFDATDGPPMKRFAILDLLLIGGLVVWWRMRKSLKAAAASLAQKMAARPQSKPTKVGSSFGSRRRWVPSGMGTRGKHAAVAAGHGAAAGGRGVVAAGRYGGRGVGAAGFGAIAGGYVGLRGAGWLLKQHDHPRFQPVMAEPESAPPDQESGQSPPSSPPDSGKPAPVPGRGPDGPSPPRHSQASLERRHEVERRLAIASHPVRLAQPRTPEVPREPAALATPKRERAYARVVRDGDVHIEPKGAKPHQPPSSKTTPPSKVPQ